MGARKLFAAALAAGIGTVAHAQIPDILTALDAGGRAMGVGGSTYVTGADTLSSVYNPAGLGYVGSTQFGIVIRNLPSSDTTLTTRFPNPDQSTSARYGSNGLTHAGVVFPIGGRGGDTRGAWGLAFTTVGYIRDFATGSDLATGNGTTLQNFEQLTKVRTDLVTLSYGRSMGQTGFNFGVGLVYALVSVTDNLRYNEVDENNLLRGRVISETSSVGNGVGAVVGMQFSPPSNPNLSIGLSYRTPIDLANNSDTSDTYDRVPAKLSGGIAIRRDGLRGGRDFVVLGVQADEYFGGQKNRRLSRDNQLVLGAGLEYNYMFGSARIPIRLGYANVPSGGDGFQNRNVFTFGLGYRPLNGNYGLDVNLASPNGGNRLDVAVALTYRLGQ